MGGYGSGRRCYGAKATTDEYLVLDIRRLNRSGSLAAGVSFTATWLRNKEELSASIRGQPAGEQVILAYRYNEEHLEYPVQLDWTACNLGGSRPWFLCPVMGCGRRVAVLYGGPLFACRSCYQLAYPVQRENAFSRAVRRANKIRNRLLWKPGFLSAQGRKPAGMHWKTFSRLSRDYEDLAGPLLSSMMQQLGVASRGDSWNAL